MREGARVLRERTVSSSNIARASLREEGLKQYPLVVLLIRWVGWGVCGVGCGV
jgi:hypothetical protein